MADAIDFEKFKRSGKSAVVRYNRNAARESGLKLNAFIMGAILAGAAEHREEERLEAERRTPRTVIDNPKPK